MMAGGMARAAVVERALHAGDVAVQPVDAVALYAQPRSAVDPGSPLAEVRHRIGCPAIVELAAERTERGDGRRCRGVVVEAEVDVRSHVHGAARPRPAERDGHHAVDRGEPGGDAPRQVECGGVAPGHRGSSRRRARHRRAIVSGPKVRHATLMTVSTTIGGVMVAYFWCSRLKSVSMRPR